MCSIVIGDIEVFFPFNPYPAQVEYMRAVIEALNGGFNALLESPTGTGKTLSLLCAILAWMEKRRGTSQSDGLGKQCGVSRLIYCSRTHTQLSQVVRELKRTRYGTLFSMAILGSREHMCINPQVLRLQTTQAQRNMCKILQEEKNCRFYRGYQAGVSRTIGNRDEVWVHDMEDLVSDARKCGYCPYYSEREIAKEADVVLLPYNYVFDVSIQKQLAFDLKKAILVVDEAHNLPSVLATSLCVNLSLVDLTNAIHDCSRAIAMRKLFAETTEAADTDEQHDFMEEQEIASLKIILCKLETCILEEDKQKEVENRKSNDNNNNNSTFFYDTGGGVSDAEIVREGSYMISFLERALITRGVFLGNEASQGEGGVNDVITKVITMLSRSESGAAVGLAKVQQFLNFVFERSVNGNYEDSCFIIQTMGGGLSGRPGHRLLGYWSFDTSRIVHTLTAGLHSLLLTSGTLSPLENFAAEIGMPFDVCLRGTHVIQPNQVLACVLCKGPSGERLNGNFAFRTSVDYRVGLGMSLVNIARNTPGGVLVFFTSYVGLNAAVELWRAGSGRAGETMTVWGMLEELKPVFVEPMDTGDFQAIVSAFQREVDSDPFRGAILLAVCRGKISEGIDFADNHGRCVVMAGIPFANHTDLFVRLKRSYISRVASQRPSVRGKPFTGNVWYVNEAMRAVNQCIGRVIRHKDDYGVVVLADERFANRLDDLSEWVARRCCVHREFRETYVSVAQFFASFRGSVTTAARASYLPSSCRSLQCTDAPSFSLLLQAQIPDSAEMARRFASEQLRLAAAQSEKQLQNFIADAQEVPVVSSRISVANDKKGKEQEEAVGDQGGGEGGGVGSVTTSDTAVLTATKKERGVFKKQVLPVVNVVARTSGLVGSTSKEFCQFLKQRLKPASYDDFRERLRQIASIRNATNLSTDEMKKALCGAVDGISTLFREAAAEHELELLEAFGEHIPNEFKSYFMHLVRKRRKMT